jgi:hypothetical protein
LCSNHTPIVIGICRIAAKIIDMMHIQSKIDHILPDQRGVRAWMVLGVLMDEDESHHSSLYTVKKAALW